jgi:dihydroorotate dehydrogenase (fumarate)
MDLSVKYMGLDLKNPLIVGSSGLTNSVEKVKELEAFGAGAVILKSLFEEQILFEADAAGKENEYDYPEAIDYIKSYAKTESINKYLKLIEDCKKETSFPIIASVNCVTNGTWLSFAKKMEEAGADAIELNVSLIPTNIEKTSEENEKIYFNIIEEAKKELKIPVALKMSHYSAGLSNLIQKLSWTKKVDAFVLFNRYYNPDIDINTLKLTSSGVFSTPADIAASLRWVAVLSGNIQTDISASTGVHSGGDLVKQILAGADSVQVVSAIYKHGPAYVKTILDELESWMTKKNFNSISEFKGKVNYKNTSNSVAFERIQFMKYFGGIE